MLYQVNEKFKATLTLENNKGMSTKFLTISLRLINYL